LVTFVKFNVLYLSVLELLIIVWHGSTMHDFIRVIMDLSWKCLGLEDSVLVSDDTVVLTLLCALNHAHK